MRGLIATLNSLRDRSYAAPFGYRVGVPLFAVIAAAAIMAEIATVNSHRGLVVFLIITTTSVVVFGVAGAVSAGVAAAIGFMLLYTPNPMPGHEITLIDWWLLLTFVFVTVAAGLATSQLYRRELEAKKAAEYQSLVAQIAIAAAEHSVSLAADGPILHTLRDLTGFDEIALYRLEPGQQRLVLLSGETDPLDLDHECMEDVARVAQASGRGRLHHKGVPAELTLARTARAVDGGLIVYLPLLTRDGVEGLIYLRSSAPASGTSFQQRMSAVVDEFRLLAVILERQRLEREAASAQAKVEAQSMQAVLLQSVTHELKTPLAAARAIVSQWIDVPGIEVDRLQRDAAMLDSAIDRLETSISELLEISRLKTADWTPHKETCEVADVLSSLLMQTPERWRSSLEFEAEDLPMFLCDPKMVARLIASFVTNAFMYGEQPVTVRVFRESERLVCEVEDHGPGIDDAEKERLFDPFFRGTQAIRRSSGTGLGLAIAAEIAQLLGGAIEVRDVVPSGVCFRFSMPLVVSLIRDATQLGTGGEREIDAG